MARRVFFSFHYQRDIWRVNQIRNIGEIVGTAAVGFHDASLSAHHRSQEEDRQPLLLRPQVISHQFGPGDVARVHARQGVVHQKVHVDLGDLGGLGERPVGLTQVVAPMAENRAVLLMLRHVTAGRIAREQPGET